MTSLLEHISFPGGGGGVPLLLLRGRVQHVGHRRGGESEGGLRATDGLPGAGGHHLVIIDTPLTTDCGRK